MGAVARPEDKVWTSVGTSTHWCRLQDFILYRGNIYTVDVHGSFGMHHIGVEPKFVHLGHLPSLPRRVDRANWLDRDKKYLVELAGDVLFVGRQVISDLNAADDEPLPEIVIPYKTLSFKVYKLDQWQPELKWVEVKDIGDYSLFLGHNTSFSVKASQPGGWWKRNCIYFTDDATDYYYWEPRGHDQGVYNLEDGSFRKHYEGKSVLYHSPPIWFTPSLY